MCRPSLRCLARPAGLVLVLTLAAGSCAQPARAAAVLEVSADGDRISLQADGVSLRYVLAEISRVGSVRVRWLVAGGEEPVALAMSARPVREVLGHLLAHRNHVLCVGVEGAGPSGIAAWVGSEIPGARRAAVAAPASPAVASVPRAFDRAVVTGSIEDLVYHVSATADPSVVAAMAESLVAPAPDVTAALLGASEQEPAAALALEWLAAESADPALQDFAQQALEELELRHRLGGPPEIERAGRHRSGPDRASGRS